MNYDALSTVDLERLRKFVKERLGKPQSVENVPTKKHAKGPKAKQDQLRGIHRKFF